MKASDEFLTEEEQRLVEKYVNEDIIRVALSLTGCSGVRAGLVLQQVDALQRLRKKVPSWTAVEGLAFPARLSLEQCSGEAAAVYKRRLVERLLPDAVSMVDLTGGLGVDFSFLAPLFKSAIYVEHQPELVSLARHNMPLLGVDNASFVEAEAEAALADMPPADLIYLDPARRDGAGRKVVRLSDCSPSVEELMPLLLDKARLGLLKLSPMLDLQVALRALKHVTEVHIVAENGECKELLLVVKSDAPDQPLVFCSDGEKSFSFLPSEEREAEVAFAASVGRYLYEPDAAVLKAGAFRLVAQRFGLQKLHANSHLYTSEKMADGFPGRVCVVENSYDYSRSGTRRFIEEFRVLSDSPKPRANVSVRNFPMQASALRDKLRLSDGGSLYVFGTTITPSRRIIVVCRKAT